MSGAWFRIPLWIFYSPYNCIYHAVRGKDKENPKLSAAYESDQEYREEFAKRGRDELPFTLGHKLVILDVFLCIIWTIWGVVEKGYYIPEIASQFL